MERETIIQTINSQLPFLRERYGVKSLGLFGSIARGEATEKSDIDILVEFESPVGFLDFIRLEIFLTQILQRKVDLISKKAIKPVLKESILKEVIYV
ncbi:MAG: nucleotidyltransferase family protein [Ignavibacteriales bacterium]|nr:nucleotidyltransferase family protein [Ignavibacteriales bacterium]